MTLLGVQTPRLRTVPAYERTWGAEVRDLASLAGLDLDPWQGDVLDDLCAESVERPGRWNTLENCMIVGRQNGKGAVLEAYVLGCLFLFDDPLIMFSAHRFDTAREMFLRIKELIAGCPDLSRRVRRVSEAHGKEGIELRSGQRIKFHARSEKAARGFSGDKVIMDEAFRLDAGMMGAVMPTMSARPNPQIVYASSAGWEISEQLGRLRRRAVKAIEDGQPDPSLTFLEWSAADETERVRGVLADPGLWAQANPALGIRISEEFIAAELRTMGAVEFARERLGVSDYPPDEEDEGGWEVIGEADWAKLAVQGEAPRPGDEGARRPAFGVDMTPDRSMAAVGAAFRDENGALVVEVINHAQGSGWVVPRCVELGGRYDCVFVVDKRGPAASLIKPLQDAGLNVLAIDTGAVADAYGRFLDAATDTRDLVHLDDEPLNEAVKGATTRPLGDRVTWDRRGDADICPLVAVTNAASGHAEWADVDADPMDNIW
ncbi:hypothetical protein [Actinomadura sp. 9N215]|uniref:hypothetical protein n=1 Tax=Actinomadura sp. 9N215 TaxID=3375150 RepID=UPI0037939A01